LTISFPSKVENSRYRHPDIKIKKLLGQNRDSSNRSLSDELDEEESHLLEELGVVAAQRAERLLGHAAQKLLRINLLRRSGVGANPTTSEFTTATPAL
jgi:hypothetical protein